jgi:hypothetical protein
MPRVSAASIIGAMESTCRRIVIEVEAQQPVSGRLSAGDEPTRPFLGWLGLLGALEAALDAIPGEIAPRRA